MDIIKSLNWRYATKKMNGKTVNQEKVDKILEAAHLAPSSSGLQPFEVFSISNNELKQEIFEKACKQSQIIDGSHVLIFASWDKYTPERIDAIFNRMDKERALPENNSYEYREGLKKILFALSETQQAHHTAKQAYISFGIALTAAATLEVDATPMEGFDNEALDTLLDLPSKGLKSAVVLVLGYRKEEEDWLVSLKKVRQPKENFITEIK